MRRWTGVGKEWRAMGKLRRAVKQTKAEEKLGRMCMDTYTLHEKMRVSEIMNVDERC